MKRVVLVQCTNSKREHPDGCRAADLYYPSQYYRAQRAYAESAGDEWFIQSAKHGLLDPEDHVEPYDKRPKDIDDVDVWAVGIADDLEERVAPPAEIELLGGKAYTDPLVPQLEARGYDAIEPLRGLGIGERKAKLKEMEAEVSHAGLPR
jgi:hypothetical protein